MKNFFPWQIHLIIFVGDACHIQPHGFWAQLLNIQYKWIDFFHWSFSKARNPWVKSDQLSNIPFFYCIWLCEKDKGSWRPCFLYPISLEQMLKSPLSLAQPREINPQQSKTHRQDVRICHHFLTHKCIVLCRCRHRDLGRNLETCRDLSSGLLEQWSEKVEGLITLRIHTVEPCWNNTSLFLS